MRSVMGEMIGENLVKGAKQVKIGLQVCDRRTTDERYGRHNVADQSTNLITENSLITAGIH